MDSYNRDVVSYLKKHGVLEQDDVLFAQQKSAELDSPLLDTLVSLNLISPYERLQVDSHIQGIPHIKLTNRKIDPQILRSIPEPVSRIFGIVAFDTDGERLNIAVTSTGNDVKDAIKEHVHTPYHVHLIDTDSLHYALRSYQDHLLEEYGNAIRRHSKHLIPADAYRHNEAHMPHRYNIELINSKSADAVLENIVEYAQTMKADSISLNAHEKGCSVSMKIGGVSYVAMELSAHVFERLVYLVLGKADIPVSQQSPLMNGSFTLEGAQGDQHINMVLISAQSSQELILDLVTQRTLFKNAYELFHSQTQRTLFNEIQNANTVVLVGGKKTGVTTTYYSLLERAIIQNKKVLSFEKNIEVDVPGVHQVAYSKDAILSNLLDKTSKTHSDVIGCPEIHKNFTSLALTSSHPMSQVITRLQDGKTLALYAERFTASSMVITHAKLKTTSSHVMKKLLARDKALIERLFKRARMKIDISLDGTFAYKGKKKGTQDKIIIRGIAAGQRLSASSGDNTQYIIALSKAVVVENALLMAQHGQLTIEEISTFITN